MQVRKVFSKGIGILLLSVCLMLPAAALAITPVEVDVSTMTSKAEAADAIDLYLDTAFEYYLAGEPSAAYTHVNNAYYVVYEVTGFERQTMSYISGARKNAVELGFTTCKAAVKKENTEENWSAVRTELMTLKTMIREDAIKLDARNELPASEMTFWVDGEQVGYDPYAELVGDTSGAKKYATWTEAAEAVVAQLDTSKEAYDGRMAEAALDNFYTAYYTVYEESGLSHAIFTDLSLEDRQATDAAFEKVRLILVNYYENNKFQSTPIKNGMRTLKNLVTAKAATIDAQDEAAAAEAAAEAAAQAAATESSTSSSGDFVIFTGAFGIIFREGLEAILVISAIIAYLVKSGNKNSLRSVYIGSLLGIVASFAAAYGITVLKSMVSATIGGSSQEIMEGCTALVATCVLFYVSNWMSSKSEAAAWSSYIDGKVQSSVEKGSSFALAFTGFLSVFREGAEVVLFYQPMLVEDGNPTMVWAGFGIGCVVLVFVYLLFRYVSVRLPIKLFFSVMSVFMAFMCVSFLGQGIKEFAEGGLLETTRIPWMPSENDVLDVFGIYPYAEIVIPQLLMAAVLVGTFIAARYRSRIDVLKRQLANPSPAKD